jgi:hypothetical protein
MGKFQQTERWASNAIVSRKTKELARQMLRAAPEERAPEELWLQIEPP